MVRVFETENWSMVSEVKYQDAWIQEIKFSPDKKHLAVSSHKGKVQIFNLDRNMSKAKKLGKNHCAVTQLDCSVDGTALKTNDTSYEILYYDVGSG